MRTLKLEKYGKVYVGGELADVSKLSDKSEFVKGIMLLDLELGEDVTVGDAVHFFFEAKDLIQSFFSEEYEVVRALVSSTRLPKQYKRLEVLKMLKMEPDLLDEENNEEFLHLLPEVDFVEAGEDEDGVANVGALPLVINENVVLKKDSVEIIRSKTKFTLLDLMVCLFEEVPALIKEGVILSS